MKTSRIILSVMILYGSLVSIALCNDDDSSPTPTSTISPTPPPLSNAQNPVDYGADPTGIADSGPAFQNAIDAGDLDVPAGTFRIDSTVNVLDNRNIRCEPGAILQYTTSEGFAMFKYNGSGGNSVFDCQFRGPNYNRTVPGYTASSQAILFIQSISGHGGNITIADNDFNGMDGWAAAIVVYGSDVNQPGPTNILISYNTFEHCSGNAIQLTSGSDNTISHNTLNDCDGMIQADDSGQNNTANLVDSNHSTFTYGTGYAAQIGGQNGNWNNFTCGASASGAAFNYSGNTCSNNTIDGPQHSWLFESAVGGVQNNARYTNNTCTQGCSVY